MFVLKKRRDRQTHVVTRSLIYIICTFWNLWNIIAALFFSLIQRLFSDAYTKNELDHNWAVGSQDDINVKDKNLAELALTQAKAIKDCEYYADGTKFKKF